MKRPALLLLAAIFTFAGLVVAGGPIGVTGPASPQQGVPYTWDSAAMPIRYTVDSGPMSVDPSGKIIINNAAGLIRVKNMFDTWSSVPTAAISFSYTGPISVANTSSDIKTVADFNAAQAACRNGTQTPIMFDANGSIRSGLGIDPAVIGFAGICKADGSTGHIVSALVLLNGEFQDGVFNQALQTTNSPPMNLMRRSLMSWVTSGTRSFPDQSGSPIAAGLGNCNSTMLPACH